MIVGTGSDTVDIGRIERTLERFGERFLRRCFTAAEIDKAQSREPGRARAATYAKRFAAKEACAKALGTGFSNGVYMKDIGVLNDISGKPILELTGGARKKLEALAPAGKKCLLHLSLSDESPIAQATVIIEAVDQ